MKKLIRKIKQMFCYHSFADERNVTLMDWDAKMVKCLCCDARALYLGDVGFKIQPLAGIEIKTKKII